MPRKHHRHSVSNLLTITALVVAGLAWTSLTASETPINVLEPATTSPATPRAFERARWSWNQPMAGSSATGDLEWQPQAFHFEKGTAQRYIDFASGSDDNVGSQAKPSRGNTIHGMRPLPIRPSPVQAQ